MSNPRISLSIRRSCAAFLLAGLLSGIATGQDDVPQMLGDPVFGPASYGSQDETDERQNIEGVVESEAPPWIPSIPDLHSPEAGSPASPAAIDWNSSLPVDQPAPHAWNHSGFPDPESGQELILPPRLQPVPAPRTTAPSFGFPDSMAPGFRQPNDVVSVAHPVQAIESGMFWSNGDDRRGLDSPAHWGTGHDGDVLFPGTGMALPDYGTGFRDAPTVRGSPRDDWGKKYDFETKKKEFPPFSEIIRTGRFFGSAELMYLKPHFQNNTAITIESPGSGFSNSFDFGYDVGSRWRAGFESRYGPGLELSYFQYDHDSRLSSFTSDGVRTGESSTWMAGPGRWTRLRAENAGETLNARHAIEINDFGVAFFKDWQLPVTRIGGGLGFHYISIHQDLLSTLTDSGGAEIGRMVGIHDFRAFGPELKFNYYRPIGHTRLDIIGGIAGAVLFGNRDQFVQNTVTGDFNRIGADEFMMQFDVNGGVQYIHHYADRRSFYARITFMSQVWLGGGTATLPQDDFGLRGLGFGVGFNR